MYVFLKEISVLLLKHYNNYIHYIFITFKHQTLMNKCCLTSMSSAFMIK